MTMTTLSRRRLLEALPLGGVTLAASLTACASGGTGALGGGGGSGKVKELIVPTARTPWLDAYRRLAAAYEDVSGIRIVLREFPYDGLYTQQVNAIQSNALPFDVFQIDEAGLWNFFENEWVVPFGEIDEKFAVDDGILTYAGLPFWNSATKTSNSQGEVMGYPINGNMDLFVYRKDVYDELGLGVPTTWDEALHNAQAAKKSGKVQYGHVPRAQATQNGLSITYEFMPVFYSYGGSWFADEGKDWTPTINSDGGIAAATMFRDLALTGPEETMTIGQAEVISLMQGGRAMQTHAVAAAANQFLDPDKSSDSRRCQPRRRKAGRRQRAARGHCASLAGSPPSVRKPHSTTSNGFYRRTPKACSWSPEASPRGAVSSIWERRTGKRALISNRLRGLWTMSGRRSGTPSVLPWRVRRRNI